MQVILASASPRRLELLKQIGLKPQVIVSTFVENTQADFPEQLVMANALGKGASILAKTGAEDVVVAADTVVVWQNKILGKPSNTAEAVKMLKLLSGHTHKVLTAIAVFYHKKKEVAVETTKVHFRKLTEQEITDYVATGEPLDKAGAYGIQGKGALLVTGIEGCYNNVVGLPLTKLYTLFAELDVTINDKLFNQRSGIGR